MFLPLHDANQFNRIPFQFVTVALIILNVAIWLYYGTAAFTAESEVQKAFVSWGYIPAVANGYEDLPAKYVILPTYASYITYSFFHSGFMHLAGNMAFLWVFGDNVEDAMGHTKFLIFYLACAAFGAFAHGLIKPDSVAPLVGASGACAGIVAAYLLLHPNIRIWVLALGKIPIRLSAFWVLGAWIAFQLFQLVTDTEGNVSWGAHVGGLVAGAILVLVLRSKGVPLFSRDLNGKLGSSFSTVPETGRDKSKGTPVANKRPSANPHRKWGRGE